ncbi:MAG TPA: chemotaxis protein CheW [Bryobacteraceae bacterium]|nr:chemotaxis protein CheW [Bryobacteraceae bacterium]
MNASATTGVRRLVRCTVGSETYCIDNDWLDSIQVVENLYPSRSADGSIGWIRRFDEKVPVYRLADQVYGGASRGPSRQGVIMVLRRNDRLWALLVDKVTAGGDVAADRVFALPEVVGDAATGYFPGVVLDERGIMLYLAPERLVSFAVSGIPRPARAEVRSSPVSRVRDSIAEHATESPAEQQKNAQGPELRKAGRQIITFTLMHEQALPAPVRFAVSAGQAVEIVSELPMIHVPHAPFFVLGVANWRSLPIPVIDLAAWLGLTPAPFTSGCRLLLCRGTMTRAGRDPGLIAIPAVDDIHKLDLPIEYKPWTEAVRWNESLALGIYRADRAMMVVPDLDAILSFQAATSDYRM